MSHQKWKLETTDELRKALEWLRRRSGSLLVIAIRSSDLVWVNPEHMNAEHKAKLLAEIVAVINPKRKEKPEPEQERGDAWEPEEGG